MANDNPFYWFLDDKLRSHNRRENQRLHIESLKKMYFKPLVRLALDKEFIPYALQYIKAEKEYGHYLNTVATILYPIYRWPNGDILKFEIAVEFQGTHQTVIIPAQAILSIESAGYPTHGYDPRYFTYFPWKIFGPLRQYGNYEISFYELQAQVFRHPMQLDFAWVPFYYQLLLPQLDQATTNSPLHEDLAFLYRVFMRMHDQELRLHHIALSDYWLKIGVIYEHITEAHFLPDHPDTNPLINLELHILEEMKKLIKEKGIRTHP